MESAFFGINEYTKINRIKYGTRNLRNAMVKKVNNFSLKNMRLGIDIYFINSILKKIYRTNI